MGVPVKKSESINPLDFARQVLSEESAAIAALGGILDESFCKAVDIITTIKPSGRLITAGMGKAGFIAMKISATMASVGVQSFFLHPAEALHGDLGRYSKDDVALILSNSGETPEILRTLEMIRKLGCPVIAITGRRESSLAKHSEVVLHIGNLDEACPLGLAPTTTTSTMLALGDALAMTILKMRRLTPKEFALFHPGGNLGRSLLLVSEIMRSGENYTVVSDAATVSEVLQKITLTKRRSGAATLIDKNGKLSGFFSDGDFRRNLLKGTSFLERPISEVMTHNPKTISPDKLAQDAARLLSQYQIDEIIVVDSDFRPIGLVDIQDVLDIKPV